jgi:tRNA dimethylallyltransferase
MSLQLNNSLINNEEGVDERSPLVVILGPTAVGKTAFSIQLAESLNGEIVSADSRLFYRGMDIGTAKPTADEMAGIPHHLIDIAQPDQILSLASFQQHAKQVIQEILARGCLPFLVGGTGQYIRAVCQGWTIPEVSPDPRMRTVLDRWADDVGKEGLHSRLAVLDPSAAENIDYRNLRRTIRALEVIFTTGRRFSEQRKTGPSPYRILLLGLTRPREELYARIDARIEAMLADGLVDEVRTLFEQGYSPDLPTLSAIGYREIISYLSGDSTLDEAVQLIKRNTRIFVRRQTNWFKANDPQIHWFSIGSETLEEMRSKIIEWLSENPVQENSNEK